MIDYIESVVNNIIEIKYFKVMKDGSKSVITKSEVYKILNLGSIQLKIRK